MTFFSEKERDNTWLQLQVCPAFLRSSETGLTCPEPEDKCVFAHPPEYVTKLASGYVVSCYDYIFSHSSSNGRGCVRPNCKYFHPAPHLRQVVITAGKNNKRLRSEIRANFQRQQSLTLLRTQCQFPSPYSPLTPATPPTMQPMNNASLLGSFPYPQNNFMLATQGLAAVQASSSMLSPSVVTTSTATTESIQQQSLQLNAFSQPEPPGTAGTTRKRNLDRADEGQVKLARLASQQSQFQWPQQLPAVGQQLMLPNGMTIPLVHGYYANGINPALFSAFYQ